MRVRMLDLQRQNAALWPSFRSQMESFVDSGAYVLGPHVDSFEREVAADLGVPYAIGCSSGSDALVVALSALGIGPGDEVLTTAFSFFATVESIVRVGAVPRFVDLEPGSFDVALSALSEAVTSRTRAILAVHLFGRAANAARFQEFAAARDVFLVEDAAQAFAARNAGRAAGTFGALGAFSFQPTKPLSALGDAGLVTTRDEHLAQRCRELVVHGARTKHHHVSFGGNYRLDALQAALLRVKLPAFAGWLAARRHWAHAYREALSGIAELVLPAIDQPDESSWSVFTIRVLGGQRDALAAFLRERGVETSVHYPLPLHRQPAVLAAGLGLPEGALPNAERAAREVLSLPIYPELTPEEHGIVSEEIRAFFGR